MVRGNYCLRVNVILFLSLSQVETIRREINSVKVTGRERERNRQREREIHSLEAFSTEVLTCLITGSFN